MQIKKYAVSLFLLISLCIFPQEDPLTALQKSDDYFFTINWTDSKSIVHEPLPAPFRLESTDSNDVFGYADTNLAEGIYPSIEGLGVLDYSGIDTSLIAFFIKISAHIKEKKINPALCIAEKSYLPYMINYRLQSLNNIKNIYFSRPEYSGGNKASARLRCLQTGSLVYFIEITTIKSGGAWLLDAADFIGEEYANTP